MPWLQQCHILHYYKITFKEVMKILSYPPLVFAYSCFFANIIQFATDQMIEIGASGEELSALIHWQYWAMSLGLFVQSILPNLNRLDFGTV